MSQKQLLAFSDGVLVPSTRYRVDPILSGLQEFGWSGESVYGYGRRDHQIKNKRLQRAYRIGCRLKRAMQVATSAHQGPVLLQRLSIPTWSGPEQRLIKRNSRVVFDFDDAIFFNSKGLHCPRRTKALDELFARCAHVIAGNNWLANYVDSRAEVTVIPTCIDTEIYSQSPTSKSVPVIGWMGTSTNYGYLEQLIGPLASLRQKYEFEFLICGDRVNAELFEKLGAKFQPWSPENEVAILRSFDIGIMPLDDNEWARGKCSFKLIQYMSVGKAAVASPVGMNCEVIDGVNNGLFAQANDWEQPLEALLKDEQFRARVGDNARRRIVDHFSVKSVLAKYDRLFSSFH